MTELGVRLVNEGVDVWAMVPAQHVSGNVYCIVDNNVEEDQACELEFKPGNLVIAMSRPNAEGNEFLAAMTLYGLP